MQKEGLLGTMSLREPIAKPQASDGGPSLLASTSPIRFKGKLMDLISQALEISLDRVDRGRPHGRAAP